MNNTKHNYHGFILKPEPYKTHFKTLIDQVVKLHGGMPAKRTRAEVVHDMTIYPTDPPVIVAALQLQVPADISAFLTRMQVPQAEAFVEKVMAQKNSDRVITAFSNNFTEFNAIEVILCLMLLSL